MTFAMFYIKVKESKNSIPIKHFNWKRVVSFNKVLTNQKRIKLELLFHIIQ